MNKTHLRGYAVRSAGESGPVTFLASTHDLGRDGMVIEKGAWDLSNYKRNPVVLDSHNYFEMPIGRTTKLEETDAGLVATIEFDMDDPKGASIRRKIARGFINAVSVGWNTLKNEGIRVTRAELLDISVVAVPGDANALAMARSAYQRRTRAATPSWADMERQWAGMTDRERTEVLRGLSAALKETNDRRELERALKRRREDELDQALRRLTPSQLRKLAASLSTR